MVTCVTEESGVIMGVRHREFVLEAVQYHPESILSEGGDALLRNFLGLKGGTWHENPDALVFDNVLPPFPYDALQRVDNAAELKTKAPTILERIYEQRLKDVQHAKSLPGASPRDLDAFLALHLAPPLVPLVPRLKARSPSLMAEIKRASPSKGDIAPNANAAHQALTYALAGAAVISVLTEPTWFKGSLLDMRLARQAIDALPNRPAILRKDFVLDEYQIAEARLWGADTVLLIVAMLPPVRLRALYAYSLSLGMEPLVEVHTTDEMRVALELGAKVIGVNNRNLHNFNVDMGTTSRLADMARGDVVLCALSGINGPEDVRGYAKEGVGAVLVGEALMRAEDPRAFIHHLLDWPLPEEEDGDGQVLVKICGIRSAEEALVAAEAGADLLGLIFVPSSKRYIPVDVARSIASAVHAFRSSPNAPPSENVNTDVKAKTRTEAETETGDGTETGGATETEAAVEQDAGNAPWFATHARRLARTLAHRRPLLVGVFQDAPLHVVQETVARVGLDLVQLHGAEPIEWARFVGVPVVRAFHVSVGTGDASGGVAKTDGLLDMTRPGLHAFVLLDAQRADGLSGGSGKTIDWARARALVDAGELDSGEVDPVNVELGDDEQRAHAQEVKNVEADDGDENRDKKEGKEDKDEDGRSADAGADGTEPDTPRRARARMPLILAGGLTPLNVAEAIARVRPWAVDVSGGVEREDGTGKDAEKVRAFMQAVKAPPGSAAPGTPNPEEN